MALTTYAGEFPRYVDKDAKSVFKKSSKISVNILKMLVLMFPVEFRSMHHSHFDTVCDALPVGFKRYIHVEKNR